jgi:BNR repeat-like domain
VVLVAKALRCVGGVVGAMALMTSTAHATPLQASPPVDASVGNPLAGCPPDGSGINFPDAEVEPWLEVNPTNGANVVGVYQQDRYSNGGAKGMTAAVSFDGGATWTSHVAVPNDTRCTGGQFQRSSDPWISFGPDGTLHAMSLVTDPDVGAAFGANGMTYNRSRDGGVSWEPAVRLITDPVGRFLNDKNSITADPNDANFVYAVWDRLQVSQGSVINPENVVGLGFKGPIYFTRTTNGGDSWEPARKIYETGANKQTLGNQIVVRPQGELFNFFADITNSSNRRGGIGPVKFSYIRSTDRGQTWTKPVRVDDMIPMSLIREDTPIDTEAVVCPDPTDQGACPIRAGDLLPEVAVDSGNGNLYAVWMDARFDGGLFVVDHDNIAFTQSTDGGLTWSAPIKVNKTPTTEPNFDQQAFTPSVHVDTDGTVVVTYYDLRNNTPDPVTLDTDYFAVSCESASESCTDPASWEEVRITPASFNIRNAPFARGYFLGDYMGLDNADNASLAMFGQAFTPNDANQYVSRLTP